MKMEDLVKIVELHKKWLNKEEGGIRADLSHQDLSEYALDLVMLNEANMERINLQGANLRYANLEKVNLQGAFLYKADLTGAYLYGANLKNADLSATSLNGVNFEEANLENVDLRSAGILTANFKNTNLTGARINWNSHYLISELLFRAADNDSRRKAAEIVRTNTHLCWSKFLAMEHPEKKWAIDVILERLKEEGRCHFIKYIEETVSNCTIETCG